MPVVCETRALEAFCRDSRDDEDLAPWTADNEHDNDNDDSVDERFVSQFVMCSLSLLSVRALTFVRA